MKANIKKLALLMIITVIATFILAATVTADRPGNLRGQYAATGSSTCLIAVCGFEPKYVTNCNNGDCGIVQSSTNETVFTFERRHGNGFGYCASGCKLESRLPFALHWYTDDLLEIQLLSRARRYD